MIYSLLLTAAETTVAETTAAATTESAQETTSILGNSNLFGIVLIGLLVAFGAYCIYAALRLRINCYLFPSKVIYPGNCAPDECADPDGFIAYTVPRLLTMGVVLAITGIVKALNDFIFKYNAGWVYYAELAVPILVFGWYMVVQNKASKRFWS